MGPYGPNYITNTGAYEKWFRLAAANIAVRLSSGRLAGLFFKFFGGLGAQYFHGENEGEQVAERNLSF